jgi:hypothetical protein
LREYVSLSTFEDQKWSLVDRTNELYSGHAILRDGSA